MNIFFFGYSVKKNAGGAERYCYNILKALADRGDKVYLYVLHDADEDPDFIYVNKHLPRNRFVDKFFLGHRVQSFLRRRVLRSTFLLMATFFCMRSANRSHAV